MLTAHLAYRPIKGHGQVGLPLILGGAAAHMGASYAGTHAGTATGATRCARAAQRADAGPMVRSCQLVSEAPRHGFLRAAVVVEGP